MATTTKRKVRRAPIRSVGEEHDIGVLLLRVIDETNRARRMATALRGASVEKTANPEFFVALVEPIMNGQLDILKNITAAAEALRAMSFGGTNAR